MANVVIRSGITARLYKNIAHDMRERERESALAENLIVGGVLSIPLPLQLLRATLQANQAGSGAANRKL